MGSRGSAATLALLLLCFAASTVFCTLEDGLPRPPNFADAPTTSYGPDPVVMNGGIPADCEWYGFANTLYDASTGASCLSVLRLALTNATVNPPGNLQPYTLYTLKRLIDPANNQSYCYQGCYNLANSVAPSPYGDPLAPPPFEAPQAPLPDGDLLAPSPNGDPFAPPPLDFSGPPTPLSDAPSPLPNGDPSSPPPMQFTPAGPAPLADPPAEDTFPVSQPVPSPPGPAPAPVDATPDATPPTTSPPAPPLPTGLNLNDGGSLVAPGSGLLSCFVAGVALILTFAAY